MGVTAKTFVQSRTVAGLQADIAAAIAAGKQPDGPIFTDPDTGLLTQAMTTGTETGVPTAYAVNGAISPVGGIAMLTKATAGAYTLAAPSADGNLLEIISTTAAAHVVTATGLVDDGVTGGSKTTMTFAAFAGASIRLRSYGGKWNVIAKNAVTIT